MASRAVVERFLGQPALAIVGVSRSGRKFGNSALRTLQGKGYRIYPIHPSADTLEGVKCFRRFEDLPEPVGGVIVVVPPAQAVDVVKEAAAAGIQQVWLQQGAESSAVLDLCRQLGIEVIAGHCVLMFAHPGGVHRVHRWFHDLRRSFGTDNRRDDGPA